MTSSLVCAVVGSHIGCYARIYQEASHRHLIGICFVDTWGLADYLKNHKELETFGMGLL